MSSQNDAGACALPAAGEGLKRTSLIRDTFNVTREILERRCLIHVTNALAQAARAVNAGTIHDAPSKRFQVFIGNRARLQASRQIKGYVENGIKRWIIGDLRPKTLQLIAQRKLVKLLRLSQFRLTLHAQILSEFLQFIRARNALEWTSWQCFIE